MCSTAKLNMLLEHVILVKSLQRLAGARLDFAVIPTSKFSHKQNVAKLGLPIRFDAIVASVSKMQILYVKPTKFMTKGGDSYNAHRSVLHNVAGRVDIHVV